MSTEHDEQPTELTYPTTIRFVLASDDSDKELCYEQSKSTKHWDNCLSHCMASIPDVLRDEIDRQPLQPIPLRQTQTRNQSFSNLRSGQEIHDRINYIAAFAGLTIAHDDQH
jgi:hypothetical protein